MGEEMTTEVITLVNGRKLTFSTAKGPAICSSPVDIIGLDRPSLDLKAYAPVLDSRGERIEGLFIRGGVYYAKVQRDGKRYIRSLKTDRKEEARGRCRAFLADVRAGNWEAVDAVRSKRTRALATVGEITDTYRSAAGRRGTPRPYVVDMNIRNLERIAGGRGVSVERLTPDLLDTFAVETQADTEPGTPARDSRDRSIASLIRSARSVLSVRQDFRDLKLSDKLSEFLDYSPVRPKLPPNLQPPHDVAVHTIEAGRKAAGDLAMVWALCFDLGLRAGEAVAARWNWIEGDGKSMSFLGIRDRPEEGYQAKSSRCRVTRERRIPVPAAVLAKMHSLARELRDPAKPILMPEDSRSAAQTFIKRDFVSWLRAADPWWQAHKAKAAHALRGLRGAFWSSKYGHTWTMQWLGHTSFQTTLDHYARALEYEEPQALDDDAWLMSRRLRAV